MLTVTFRSHIMPGEVDVIVNGNIKGTISKFPEEGQIEWDMGDELDENYPGIRDDLVGIRSLNKAKKEILQYIGHRHAVS